MRSVYKCSVCKQPKKGHVCNKVRDDEEYETHCQICFLEYSSNNIKTGPMKDQSCHMCCESCFTKMIKIGRDGKANYKCPWCRENYILSDYISSHNSEIDIDTARFVSRMVERIRYNKMIRYNNMMIQERERKKKERMCIKKYNRTKLIAYVYLVLLAICIYKQLVIVQ
jgi:hypothetical protein